MVEARGNSGDPGDGPRNPFTRGLGRRHVEGVYRKSVYLVDPASSHMLVLKAKPCMCQYQLLDGQAANGSLHHLRLVWQHV